MVKAGLDQAIPFMVDGSANAHAASKYLLQTEAVDGARLRAGRSCGSTALAGGFPE
jgi:hypothetical protein